MRSPAAITANLWGVKDFVYESVYNTPKNVEIIKNIPMTERQREAYQRENGIRYFRKILIYNEPPVYSYNPGINAHMDAMRPRIPDPRAEITCLRCWSAVA